MPKFDFLVIGSGVAGLSYALKVAQSCPDASIAIVTKADAKESNTKYAQGGIAVVLDTMGDSYEKHIEDTMIAGDGLCVREVVELVVKEGPARLDELIAWGANFDENKKGEYDLGLEGGHSKHRILHHKDITGLEIERTLVKQAHATPNIHLFAQHQAVELITQFHFKRKRIKTKLPMQTQCYGAYIFNNETEQIETFSAKVTLLASGGIGQVYQNTTNPTIATGDGIAIAHRAKADVQNMEFIQFHPTALYYPQPGASFLISEAVRGFGALLRNKKGKLFMEKYDERKELAPRDIVSRAIDSELKKSGDPCVYLDCRHLDLEKFIAHFPNIFSKCKEIGLDLTKDMIPVVPAAHYLCGGISVDEWGRTTIDNLYACGECTYTGLHGANRLASNSLLEAIVFSHRCYENSIDAWEKRFEPEMIPAWDEEGTTQPEELILITHNRNELRAMMSDYVAIIRSEERLDRAMKRLPIIYDETEELYQKTKVSPQLIELRNLITIAYLIVKQSMKRDENRGGFYKVKKGLV